MYINAVRSIDLRGCLPMAVNVAGFPGLLEIFPHLDRIKTTTHELKRNNTSYIHSTETTTVFTVYSTYHVPFLKLNDTRKFKIPPLDLPKSFSVTGRIRLICKAPTSTSEVYKEPWQSNHIPAMLHRHDIGHLEILDANNPLVIGTLIMVLQHRQRIGLRPIDSLSIESCNLQPSSHLANIIESQSEDTNGAHINCLKHLRLRIHDVSEFHSELLPLTPRCLTMIDWGSLRGLQDLELDIFSEELYSLYNGYIRPNNRSTGTPSLSRGPAFRAPMISLDSLLADAPAFLRMRALDLRSLTIHFGHDTSVYADDFAPMVHDLLRILPRVTEFAKLLLAIGGPLCKYDIRPHDLTWIGTREDGMLMQFYCASVKQEISRLITENNGRQAKGWQVIARNPNIGIKR
jgi:hypothetical protein